MSVYNKSGYNHSQYSRKIEGRTLARIHYIVQDKMKILEAVEGLVEKENITFNQAAVVVRVDQSMVWHWAKKRDKLFSSPRAHQILQVHPGPTSILQGFEEELVRFVEEWCLKGLPVNWMTLQRKACSLIPSFGKKSEQAAKMSISHFMVRNHLTHRMATHKGQHHPSKVEGEVLQFLNVIRPVATAPTRHLDYVMNMDQTPMFHAMDFQSMIDTVGAHTVNLRTAASDTKHVTVTV
jgi:hypothetical protein